MLKFMIYYLYQDVYVAFTLLVFFPILNLLNTIFLYIPEFEEVDHCGGNIFLNDDNATTIYSPSFPLNYEQGLDCVWSIQSDMYVEIEIRSVSLQMSTSLNDLQKVFSLLSNLSSNIQT